jgi:hypothetical protein
LSSHSRVTKQGSHPDTGTLLGREVHKSTSVAYVLGKRAKYFDPVAICEARHNRSNMWENDNVVFKECQISKAIVEQRKYYHKEPMNRVAAYIAMMRKICLIAYMRHTILGKSSFNHLL